MISHYELSSPGELVHIDVKKVGKIPRGVTEHKAATCVSIRLLQILDAVLYSNPPSYLSTPNHASEPST